MRGVVPGLRRVGFAWLLVSGLCVPAQAHELSDERPAGGQAGATAVVPAAPPPFWVAGVVIAPARRSAILVPLDEARRELGIVTLHEGERYDRYRLVTVEPARVLLEADGAIVSLSVGRPYSGPRGAATRPGPIFIPGPDKPRPDLEYTGSQVPRAGGGAAPAGAGERPPDTEAIQDFVERLFSHPQLQQQIEEIRPLIRQKMERGQGTPAGAAR